MKTRLLSLFVLLVCGVFAVYGQESRPPKFNLEEFKQKRNEFLKKEIGLTQEEAKVFIPLSNELMRKKFELNKSIIEKNRELMKKTPVSDAEYEEIIKETFSVRFKELKLEKEYYEKFKAILSPEKIYKYQRAEMKLSINMLNNRERPDKQAKPPKWDDNRKMQDKK
jgi:viroplasmin and RNaseH domain-containing protein